MSTKHGGVTCNGCARRDFRFRRYKCLVCRDYDLCGSCFDSQLENEKHFSFHPMQCLITKADHDVFYSGESSTKYCVQSFTCSVCNQLGFTESSLLSHVFTHHPNTIDSEVLCPFCAIQTEGDPNRTTYDIANHFKTVHNFQPPVSGKSGIQSSHSTTSSQQPTTSSISDFVRLRSDRLKHVNNTDAVHSSTSQNQHFSVDDKSCCYNANNYAITKSLSTNSRFTTGCIVAMKNYLKNYENNKTTDGLLDQPIDLLLQNNNELTRNSTALHCEHDMDKVNSHSEVNQSINSVSDKNNQNPTVKTQENATNHCTSTVSVIRNSRPNDISIPSSTENTTTPVDQVDHSSINANSNLESFTSEISDHKLKSINPNSSKYSKSLSNDLHTKSVNDEKNKESNKKPVFNSHCMNDSQSTLPAVLVQDEWDIDWHVFLNELIWSSLCSNEVSSNVT
ncbi:unnamed protein product [Schistosoma turkestanicum]|nr:unnamed protein product [Schistosoma turkestanicum]